MVGTITLGSSAEEDSTVLVGGREGVVVVVVAGLEGLDLAGAIHLSLLPVV